MSVPNFIYTCSQFDYRQSGSEDPSVVSVQFIPLGGQEFGVLVLMDRKEIARYRHSGSFTSTHAAEYVLDAVSGYIRDAGQKRAGAPETPVIALKRGS